MVSGSTIGHIAVWDLEDKCLHSEIVDAHSGPVNGLRCLPNEPLLITSSADNSIKVCYMLYVQTIIHNKNLFE